MRNKRTFYDIKPNQAMIKKITKIFIYFTCNSKIILKKHKSDENLKLGKFMKLTS